MALDRAWLPLATVFTAAWLVATAPGLNTRTLMIQTGISRRATAWLLLSRTRRAMLAALAEPLTGEVEASEAWFGGPQKREKRRKQGNRALMVLALAEARPAGRCRLVRIDGKTTPTLLAVIAAQVGPGSLLRTDLDALLRVLAAAPPRTRDQMANGAGLPPVLGTRPTRPLAV